MGQLASGAESQTGEALGLTAGSRRCEAREGSGLVYLSGRQRAGKEMNGKSANLNNCLRQLYPGDHPVPATEVVCIFDADQARPDRKP